MSQRDVTIKYILWKQSVADWCADHAECLVACMLKGTQACLHSLVSSVTVTEGLVALVCIGEGRVGAEEAPACPLLALMKFLLGPPLRTLW